MRGPAARASGGSGRFTEDCGYLTAAPWEQRRGGCIRAERLGPRRRRRASTPKLCQSWRRPRRRRTGTGMGTRTTARGPRVTITTSTARRITITFRTSCQMPSRIGMQGGCTTARAASTPRRIRTTRAGQRRRGGFPHPARDRDPMRRDRSRAAAMPPRFITRSNRCAHPFQIAPQTRDVFVRLRARLHLPFDVLRGQPVGALDPQGIASAIDPVSDHAVRRAQAPPGSVDGFRAKLDPRVPQGVLPWRGGA